MKIVGTGCGPGLLTEMGIREIRQAKTIYGSERAIQVKYCFATSPNDMNVCRPMVVRVYDSAEAIESQDRRHYAILTQFPSV